MAIPIVNGEVAWHRCLKADFRWLSTHRCRKHGKRYLSHSGCFTMEHPEGDPLIKGERVGYLDIEATNLQADFGYILSYCILDDQDNLDDYLLSEEEIRSFQFDKNLMKQLVEDIRKYDRLIVYYGRDYRFDVPYIRTRALHWRLPFPYYRELYVNDCYDIVKKKLRLHRGRLETACDFLGIPSKEHRMIPTIWQRAQIGDVASLKIVGLHNKEDVFSLRELWRQISGFVMISNSSI